MIDIVYHCRVGYAKPKDNLSLDDGELSPEALALIDHIGQILAEEYVKLLKENPEEKQKEEE